jgi:hypothetical protein
MMDVECILWETETEEVKPVFIHLMSVLARVLFAVSCKYKQAYM